jgi:hypothetical protein
MVAEVASTAEVVTPVGLGQVEFTKMLKVSDAQPLETITVTNVVSTAVTLTLLVVSPELVIQFAE